GRWQVSVYRDRAGDDARLCTRRTGSDAGRLIATVRCREPARALLAAPPEEPVDGPVPDPAASPSFLTPASRNFSGQILRTDLSYAELDAARPEPERRVVVTALQAIERSETGGGINEGGALLGVVRVGLLARRIADEVAAIRVNQDPEDPFRIF